MSLHTAVVGPYSEDPAQIGHSRKNLSSFYLIHHGAETSAPLTHRPEGPDKILRVYVAKFRSAPKPGSFVAAAPLAAFSHVAMIQWQSCWR